MKSQDVGLLLKLALLHKYGPQAGVWDNPKAWPYDWQDWEAEEEVSRAIQDELPGPYLLELSEGALSRIHSEGKMPAEVFTTRGLEKLTGISKSQVSLSLARCYKVGLARPVGENNIPVVNIGALLEFITYGLRYVFPVFPEGLERGIGTSCSAPVLAGKLLSSGELDLVWPAAAGKRKGLGVQPLYPGAIQAAMKDPHMYACLALLDAIRMGKARERNLALKLLKEEIEP